MQRVLDEAAEAEAVATETASAAFEELAAKLGCHDDEPSLEDVHRILQAAGKSTAELKERAAYYEQRCQQRAIVEAARAAKLERAELQRKRAAADMALAAAEEVHRQSIKPIVDRLAELAEIERQAFHARRELQDGCDDQKLRQAIKSNEAGVKGIEAKVKVALEQVQRLEARLNAELRRPAPGSKVKWLAPGDGTGGDPAVVSRCRVRLSQATDELRRVPNHRVRQLLRELRQVDIRETLRREIVKSGRTHYGIAKDAKLTPGIIDRFVSGERDIMLGTAAKLAFVLGLQLTPKSMRKRK